MEFTPNDMRNHEFGTQMRGFDKAEVKAFVEKVAEEFENALNQAQALKTENEKISAQYQQLKDLEDTIRSAVLEAQKNANQIIANAKKEAELLISQARQDRDKIFEERQREMLAVEERLKKLEYQKESFYSKLRSEIEAHLKLVDSMRPADRQIQMKAEEVTPDEEIPEELQEPKKESPSTPPALEMKDDEIDAALDHLSGGSSEEKAGGRPQEPVRVESENRENVPEEKSEANEGVQDGQSQPKGYDF